MESKLSVWFKLAESWGAVLLLDEADVWLERRMIADLKRNVLVAGQSLPQYTSGEPRITRLINIEQYSCIAWSTTEA